MSRFREGNENFWVGVTQTCLATLEDFRLRCNDRGHHLLLLRISPTMASKRLAQSLFVGKGSLLQACRPAVHLEGTVWTMVYVCGVDMANDEVQLLGNHRTLATETAIPSTTQIIPPPPQEPAPLHYTKRWFSFGCVTADIG